MMKFSSGYTMILIYFVVLLSPSNGQYLVSQNYPQNYYDNMDCTYTISLTGNVTASSQINLTMYDFMSESCCDYLDIYQSTNSFSVRRQGSIGYSNTIQLLSYPVVLQFHSDYSVVYRGFNFFYKPTTSNAVATCDRSCTGNFQGASIRSCGPTVNCYNNCNQTTTTYEGTTCPNYYRFIQSFYSYVSNSTVYECFSLCQNRYYQSSVNCSNDNAYLCQYANNPSGCNALTTPGPSQYYGCYNPCSQTWFSIYGTSCPNYFSLLSTSSNYVGWPLYAYVTVYQCYSNCQSRNYTSNSTTCSNSNANLCLNPDYASTLSQCQQSSNQYLYCYFPCNQTYSYYYGSACPQYSTLLSSSVNYLGYPYYSYVTVFQCYSYCQNRLYSSNGTNCSNSNANLCSNSYYAGILPECFPITTTTQTPMQLFYCYNPCNSTYSWYYGFQCPNYFQYMQSYMSYLTWYTTAECYSLCQNRYYSVTNGNCSNSNANQPQTQQCFNPCSQQYVTVTGSCTNYFRYVGQSTVLVNGMYQNAVDCFSYCQNQYYSLSTGTCSNNNANLCLNTRYYPNGCQLQQIGTIESPNYPNSNIYPVQCTYTVTTTSESSFQLRMNVFNTATCCETVDISTVDNTTGKTYNLAYLRGFSSGWTASVRTSVTLRYNSTAGGLGSAFQFAYHGLTGQYFSCYRSCSSPYYWYYYDTICGYNSTATPPGMPNNLPTFLTCVNPCTGINSTFYGATCPVYSRYVSSITTFPMLTSAYCYSYCQNTYYSVLGSNCSNENANLCANRNSSLCLTTPSPWTKTTGQSDDFYRSLSIGIGVLAAIVVLCIIAIAVIVVKCRLLKKVPKKNATQGETNISICSRPELPPCTIAPPQTSERLYPILPTAVNEIHIHTEC